MSISAQWKHKNPIHIDLIASKGGVTTFCAKSVYVQMFHSVANDDIPTLRIWNLQQTHRVLLNHNMSSDHLDAYVSVNLQAKVDAECVSVCGHSELCLLRFVTVSVYIILACGRYEQKSSQCTSLMAPVLHSFMNWLFYLCKPDNRERIISGTRTAKWNSTIAPTPSAPVIGHLHHMNPFHVSGAEAGLFRKN